MKGLMLTLISAGFLCLIPGALWLRDRNLSEDDAAAAVRPLARIPLHQFEESGSSAVIFTIPNDAQWKRIRSAWGEPAYLVAAVEQPEGHRMILCLDQLGMRVEATRQSGPVELRTAKGCCPYGFFAACPDSGLEFRATPGNDITLHAASTAHSLPKGELIVICNWNDLKDKIVGIMLAEDLWRISKFATPAGLILMLSGVSLLVRRRVQRRR